MAEFPVLSAGPTPAVPLDQWDFRVLDVDGQLLARWDWSGFRALPQEAVTCDIHCVTGWSKLAMSWRGVSVDVVLAGLEGFAAGRHVMAFADGGLAGRPYTANLPVTALTGGRAWVATGRDGHDLEADHGGPARLLVPHLYLWKSAKWARGLQLLESDRPGFWEGLGYHNAGDPWREQRFGRD